MRIWHFDAVGAPDGVDGVSTLLWRLAAAQARAGHDTTLFVRTEPAGRASEVVAETGLRLVEISRSFRHHHPIAIRRLGGDLPDVVVLHGSWIPFHAALAVWCRIRRIPYVYVPHGGHTTALGGAGHLRHRIYARTVERFNTFGAAAVIGASQAELDEAEALFGRTIERGRVAPGPAAIEGIEPTWTYHDAGSVVYLGRFHVFHKGIDDLCELARRRPETRFDLYGEPPLTPEAFDEFEAVRRRAPDNVTFHEPVTGEDKHRMLESARLYLQYSRFEGFPLAVIEALATGVPVVCADRLPFAREAARDDAVALISSDPVAGAQELQALLDDPARLRRLSTDGLTYVAPRRDPDALGAGHVAVYRAALIAGRPG